MGMTCDLYRAAASETDRLRANPTAVEELLFPPGSTPPVVEVREKGLTGWILHLIGVKITQVDPNWVPPEQTEPDDGSELDLEKMWHGLHYIFTGTAWEGEPPACFLVHGGEQIGDEDADSRPRLLDPTEVRQFSAFLASLSDDEFTRRYDPERMTALNIDPDVIWKRDAASDHPPIEHLRTAFGDLRNFVAAAAERGDAIVIALN
jgi:Domain of unknown function (DUF1877)